MMVNRFDDAPWMNRPNRDVPTIAATLAVVPAVVLMVFGANRLGLIHLVPVVATILPLAATDWKSAALLRASAAFLLGVFALLGGMTIGVVFVPAAALWTWGMVRAVGRYDSGRREGNP